MPANLDPAKRDPSELRPSLEDRVQELECIVSHLQATIDDLNEALLLQQKKIDKLSLQLQHINSIADSSWIADNSAASLSDEKPPHY
jgi:uncharacterized coiled-coil protein SlyX